ncbi:MAG TPA: GYD domain-containing protein [Acidobacteriaceae bacterium]|nr:GYD domain-containing protein [Acidobacteriaceae bacterium]
MFGWFTQDGFATQRYSSREIKMLSEYVLLMKADQTGSVGMLSASSEGKAACSAAIESLGGRLHAFLPVIGAYDVVVHASFPDDVSVVVASHAWNVAGMYTEAMRALSPAEMESVGEMSEKLIATLHKENKVSHELEQR